MTRRSNCLKYNTPLPSASSRAAYDTSGLQDEPTGEFLIAVQALLSRLTAVSSNSRLPLSSLILSVLSILVDGSRPQYQCCHVILQYSTVFCSIVLYACPTSQRLVTMGSDRGIHTTIILSATSHRPRTAIVIAHHADLQYRCICRRPLRTRGMFSKAVDRICAKADDQLDFGVGDGRGSQGFDSPALRLVDCFVCMRATSC